MADSVMDAEGVVEGMASLPRQESGQLAQMINEGLSCASDFSP
jgi:hypothetical protein